MKQIIGTAARQVERGDITQDRTLMNQYDES
jgi:hypothetical protein